MFSSLRELLSRFVVGKDRRRLIMGPLFKLIEVIFDLLTPLVIAQMTNLVIADRQGSELFRLGIYLVLMALFGFLFSLICQKMASQCSQGTGTRIRDELFSHILQLSSTELDSFGPSSLLNRLTQDVERIQLALALLIRQLIRWPLLAIGSAICALCIDLKMGLIFLVVVPLVVGLFWLVMSRVVVLFSKLTGEQDRLLVRVRENLSGVRVIRSFSREKNEVLAFNEQIDTLAHTSLQSAAISSLLSPVTMLIMDLGICAILFQGAGAVELGRLTQGDVLAFVNYMMQALVSISFVANLVVIFTQAATSARRILEAIDCTPSVEFTADAGTETGSYTQQESSAAQLLSCEKLSYIFPGAHRPALEDISFTLYPQESLGIIGGTGSGKTTLAELLVRLKNPSSGHIRLRGEDIASFSQEKLREVMSFVPQQSSLISGTLRSNLVWRDTGATDDEVFCALECAQAKDFVVALEEGLETPVDLLGANFSGGQRQRLTIARALVGHPTLLVLDDANSALDLATDAALIEALGTLEDTTCVLISQRVASVMRQSKILVLDHGYQVGFGTHEELLESCSVYRELYESQLGEEVL